MRRTACTLVLGVVAALTGCDAVPDLPTELEALAPGGEVAALGVGMAGPAARGSGHLMVGDEYRTFSFHARDDAGGALNLQARQLDIHLKGDIACVNVIDNRAVLVGYFSRGAGAYEEGAVFGFMVEDNGEGEAALPDRISLLVPFPIQPGFPTYESIGEFLCDSDPSAISSFFPLQEFEGGNIQVQP